MVSLPNMTTEQKQHALKSWHTFWPLLPTFSVEDMQDLLRMECRRAKPRVGIVNRLTDRISTLRRREAQKRSAAILLGR